MKDVIFLMSSSNAFVGDLAIYESNQHTSE